MAASETWTDPERCPFCESVLASPGAGFVTHLAESPDCKDRFETWCDRVSEDLRGGWGG